MSPQGSSWPPVDDSWRSIDEAVSAFTANLPRELAEAVETLQQVIGVNPHNFSSELGLSAFADVGAGILARCRFEIGEYTHPGSVIDHPVLWTNPARFTAAPLVFPIKSFAAIPDHNENYWIWQRNLSGFRSLRRVTGYTAKTSDRAMKYLAIQLP